MRFIRVSGGGVQQVTQLEPWIAGEFDPTNVFRIEEAENRWHKSLEYGGYAPK